MNDVQTKNDHQPFLQAGGHGGNHQLIARGKYLLKPCLSERERDFYVKIQQNKEWIDNLIIPRFYGLEFHDIGYGELQYIKMENLMYKLNNPFVLDLKIGTQTWDPETALWKMNKRLRVDSTSTTESLGFRFSGMQRKIGAEPIFYSRYLCTEKVNTREATKDYMKLFFFNGTVYRKELIPFYIGEIKKMIKVMKKKEYKMFSTSVLFVYDGFSSIEDKKHSIRIIDFAHTWNMKEERCEVDDGFLFGLQSLKKMLREIYNELNQMNK